NILFTHFPAMSAAEQSELARYFEGDRPGRKTGAGNLEELFSLFLEEEDSHVQIGIYEHPDIPRGEYLREVRSDAGYSREELAAEVGVEPDRVRKWEELGHNLGPSSQEKLEKALGVRIPNFSGKQDGEFSHHNDLRLADLKQEALDALNGAVLADGSISGSGPGS
ncbi:MAG: helix-turn-helix domain-containing protein, partial [Candidatus Nanohaloarchaea archaeon]|nr:helix-turn-helix domain-containing protein [Candidatus Nanohaloarchaea archaeon]